MLTAEGGCSGTGTSACRGELVGSTPILAALLPLDQVLQNKRGDRAEG